MMFEISMLSWKNTKSGSGSDCMNYTLKQELLIHGLIKEKMRTLHDQLNDRKVPLTDTQRDLSIRELRSYQELIYQNRLNRQIELR